MEIIRSIIVMFTILFFVSSGISSTSSVLPVQQLIHTILRSNTSSNKTFELRKFEKELLAFAPEDEKEIRMKLKEIRKIVNAGTPPELKKKNICKSCAYFDLCFI